MQSVDSHPEGASWLAGCSCLGTGVKGTVTGGRGGREKTNLGARTRVQLTVSPGSAHHLTQGSRSPLQLPALCLPPHHRPRAQKTLGGHLATYCSVLQMRKLRLGNSLTCPAIHFRDVLVEQSGHARLSVNPCLPLLQPRDCGKVLLTPCASPSSSIKWV